MPGDGFHGKGGWGDVLGAFSASSVLKEMSQRESMSRLLLKTRDLITKIFFILTVLIF